MPGVNCFLLVVFFVISSSCFLHYAAASVSDPLEVGALQYVKNSLVDPMKKLNSWNDGDPCTSKWTGILCTAVQNDGYLHIQEIQLLKSNLSGTLVRQIGLLSHLKIVDFMWNNITGSIPREMGNLTSLKLLLLTGNQISGSLPEEIGNLVNLNRLQIDQNQISGAIPQSFSNLNSIKHLHMNNNSISGQLLLELSRLPKLRHLLVDNNNLSGHLPSQFSSLPSLKILQLDNNNFSGSIIPASYGNMTTLVKLSLRNCSLQGAIPDFSGIPQLSYLDLSWNHLKGPIPSKKLSLNITTIDLSGNFLDGLIPSSFAGLPRLQRLSLGNNFLTGSVPSVWQNMTFDWNETLIMDFQNNSLTDILNGLNPPANVSILLYGNPICKRANQLNVVNFCKSEVVTPASGVIESPKTSCFPCPTDLNYEYNPLSPIPCLCAVPLGVGLRLKSPSISDFRPYSYYFVTDMSSLLNLYRYQLYFSLYSWEKGPRLNIYLKLFPSNSSLFNTSEVIRLQHNFTAWEITLSDIFGPYELLNFTLGYYANVIPAAGASRLTKGALTAILLGSIAGAIIISALVTRLIMRSSKYQVLSNKRLISKSSIKIDGVKGFTLKEMGQATDNFSDSMEVGHGGYGKVYKGILADGTIVAIKRAQVGSLQGSKEFFTEIELLSRLHHRNLVSLVGYCDEDDEQMLVYEFMQNGTLRDHLSAKSKVPLSVSTRLRIALETARGILYLHTEADPPVIHRDIKASNILLDSKFVAKVADFGISRLAPAENTEGIIADHVSTVVKGTPGYLDPEYFLTHKLTDRSDVYSLGVVFLELLTGMHPIWHGKNIVREVSMSYRSGKVFSIIDSRMGAYPSECIQKFVSLALRCCHDDTNARPSMAEVVRELEIIWSMMPEIDSAPSASMLPEPAALANQSSSSSIITAFPCVSSSSSNDRSGGVIPSVTAR